MPPRNVAQKLIADHLLEGEMTPGEEIGLRIDQTLTQDATGTLVMLELEAMQLDRVKTELSAQYVDHNLLQVDSKNPDDHLFLQSACRRFGVWFSQPGGGVSHPVHQEHFGKPGKTLLGSDSHTCAAGAIGMLAIGAGGLEVAMAMAGHPFYVNMPEIWGIELTGSLPDWVSAKDVILEMLRRHGVKGGVGRIIEYHGPGLDDLGAMDRHVIANMGAELGATTTVFPSDQHTREFLRSHGREDDWTEIKADEAASYDVEDSIDLAELQPLIALPTSPGNVETVESQEGEPIYQAYVGSSANPGFRDFAVVAEMVSGKKVASGVSLDINPTSRKILQRLVADGYLTNLLEAGGRLHQTGCNGCIGMGQAPASGKVSLRTVPRNFPGRSGTDDDRVFLVSPETAAASALRGKITDPRRLGDDLRYPNVKEPEQWPTAKLLEEPPPEEVAMSVELVKGPNIATLPDFEQLPDEFELPVLLKMGDNISTDEILPAGAEVLPLRSNIPAISKFSFSVIDGSYSERARELREGSGHAVIGGENYGQGSSREHAALGPRYLGLRLVIAVSFARIHWQNLVNFGLLPLEFNNRDDYENIEADDKLRVTDLRRQIEASDDVTVENVTQGKKFTAGSRLSRRQKDVMLAGGLINWVKARK